MMKSAITKSSTVFVKFGCQDTRRNLPRALAGKRTESNFLRSFERAYFAAEVGAAVAGREFALEGFGCADLVWLAWESRDTAEGFTALALKRVRITAVEGKVSDWRKGLQQAFRYRHFAHRALLVLPMRTAKVAAEFLQTFRRLRVGLWGFDPVTGHVKKWCTPRVTPPLNRRAGEKALRVFELRLDFSKLAKSD
jgi:hypothetical protein